MNKGTFTPGVRTVVLAALAAAYVAACGSSSNPGETESPDSSSGGGLNSSSSGGLNSSSSGAGTSSSSGGTYDATVFGDDATSDDGSSDDATSDAPAGDDGSSPADGGAVVVAEASVDSGVETVDGSVTVDAGKGDAGEIDASSAVDAGKPVDAGGGDAAIQDGGAEGGTTDTAAAGSAAVTAFCNATCAAETACGDAKACNACNPAVTANDRADYVSDLTSCVPAAIAAACTQQSNDFTYCQVLALSKLAPSAAAITLCTKVASSNCGGVLGATVADCLGNAGIYSDATIAAYSACLVDVPDASFDGGCNSFGTCLYNASIP